MQPKPTPDELELRAHVARGSFESEVGRKWSSVRLDWPFVHVAVFARPIDGKPDRFWFRFDCTNYPVDMPTARPWDAQLDAPLAQSQWPGGDSIVTGVFRPTDWRDDALYLPCDRIAATTHDANWVNAGPAHLRWTSDSDITQYLNEIHTLINSAGYTGPRSA